MVSLTCFKSEFSELQKNYYHVYMYTKRGGSSIIASYGHVRTKVILKYLLVTHERFYISLMFELCTTDQ